MKKLPLFLAAIPLYAAADIYRFTFCRDRSKLSTLLLDKKTHEPDYYLWRDERADRLKNAKHLRFEMLSERGETLCGFYYPCREKPTGRIAFIVHGYHSEHIETAGMLFEYYHSRGFDVFTCDNTASGVSGGRLFGYDVFESDDCLKWLYFLINEFGSDVQIVMHGFSLGGATVLKMSDRCPDAVKFIVSDSGFSGADTLLRSRLGAALPIYDRINRLLAGYALCDTRVEANVKGSPLPFLIVHGKDDPTVPFYMAEDIFAMCPNEKDCLFTEGTRHIETMFRAPELYETKLDAFIEKYVE